MPSTASFGAAFCSCFLGYKLDKDHLRQGLMSEAVQECVRIAFEELGLHRIEANIMPHNLPSLGVAEKCGFVREGLSRKYLKINGGGRTTSTWFV